MHRIYDLFGMISILPTKRISALSQDGGESQLALKLRHCHAMYRLTVSSVIVLLNVVVLANCI